MEKVACEVFGLIFMIIIIDIVNKSAHNEDSRMQRSDSMAQTNINIRMDEKLKRDFDGLCGDLGLTMTAAFNVFAKTMVRQRKIPFEISLAAPDSNNVATLEDAGATKKASATSEGLAL